MGLTALLWCFTFLLSLTSTVSGFEFDLFLYLLELQPANRELVSLQSIRFAPQWSLLLIYGLIMALYVNRYTRSPITAMSIFGLILILFGLLMLEVLLAVFLQFFLPLMFPALVMLLVSVIYRGADVYQGITISSLLKQEPVDLSEVRARIDSGDPRTALTLLKQCGHHAGQPLGAADSSERRRYHGGAERRAQNQTGSCLVTGVDQRYRQRSRPVPCGRRRRPARARAWRER